LYTAIDIYEQEIISLFKGEVLSSQAADQRVERGEDQYFIVLLDGSILDSMHADCYAKYANDSNGSVDGTHSNNAQITLDDEDNVCIVATDSIKAGEEIFCGYGKAYWAKHKT